MTMMQFEALSASDKYNTLLAHGVYHLYRHSEDHTILLFQLECFYVELYYHKNDETKLDFQALSSTDQLEPYLNQMPIALAQLTPEAGVYNR